MAETRALPRECRQKEEVMKIIERLENTFAAVAFAEEGEHETARLILREKGTGASRGRCAAHAEDCQRISDSPSRA
jgi:hypothetical protein